MKSINNGKQMKSIWRLSAPSTEEKSFGKHPTQKPVSLLERILLASTNKGNFVFDPFSGSGTTGVAAIKLQRKFVGCELETDFITIVIKRLTQAINQKTNIPQTLFAINSLELIQ